MYEDMIQQTEKEKEYFKIKIIRNNINSFVSHFYQRNRLTRREEFTFRNEIKSFIRKILSFSELINASLIDGGHYIRE